MKISSFTSPVIAFFLEKSKPKKNITRFSDGRVALWCLYFKVEKLYLISKRNSEFCRKTDLSSHRNNIYGILLSNFHRVTFEKAKNSRFYLVLPCLSYCCSDCNCKHSPSHAFFPICSLFTALYIVCSTYVYYCGQSSSQSLGIYGLYWQSNFVTSKVSPQYCMLWISEEKEMLYWSLSSIICIIIH